MEANVLSTRVSEMLGAKYPIFGFTHEIDVVVEVCLAGGIGVYGGTRNTPEEITEALEEIKSRVGDLPFGIDLVLPKNMPEKNNREEIEAELPNAHRNFVDYLYEKYDVPRDNLPGKRSRFVRSEEVARNQLDAVLRSDAKIFAMGVGSPPEMIGAAKEFGKTVLSLVGAPRHAEKALDAGADLIVAQGYDAGAHTGEIGTFSMVPQIVDLVAGRIPVLAAGGVATGRHIAAALALGAEGVWMGTPWLTTKEHNTSPKMLAQLLNASSNDTIRSRSNSGKTLRMIKSAWSEEWEAEDSPKPLQMPYQDILVGDLLGSISRHEVEPLLHQPAGQGIAFFNEVKTVQETMEAFVAEASAVVQR